MKELIIRGVTCGDTFMRLPLGLTKEKWAELATQVSEVGHGYTWWIADLAAYAYQYLDGRASLRELAKATGNGQQHINQLARVAREYPVRQRVKGISIGHHIALIKETPAARTRLLHAAKAKAWSTDMLRDRVIGKENRKIKIIVRIPYTKRHKVAIFQKLAKELGGTCYVWGSVRPDNRRRALHGQKTLTLTA